MKTSLIYVCCLSFTCELSHRCRIPLKRLHFQSKRERNNKRMRAEHVYFSLSASGSLNWTHFLLHCEFIWIQSFEKDKVFGTFFFSSNLKWGVGVGWGGVHSFHLVCWMLPKIQKRKDKTNASFTVLHFNALRCNVSWFSVASFQKSSITPFACKQSAELRCLPVFCKMLQAIW